MFRSYCFCSYSNTAYKSPHFPFLTFPILLVPYFVPPSNLLGTLYKVKVNRLENLIKVKTYRLDKANDIMTLQTSAGTYVICEKRIENCKKAIGIPNSATIISTTSAQNHGYLEYCTYNYDGDYAYIGMLVHTDNPRWAVINIAYVL